MRLGKGRYCSTAEELLPASVAEWQDQHAYEGRQRKQSEKMDEDPEAGGGHHQVFEGSSKGWVEVLGAMWYQGAASVGGVRCCGNRNHKKIHTRAGDLLWQASRPRQSGRVAGKQSGMWSKGPRETILVEDREGPSRNPEGVTELGPGMIRPPRLGLVCANIFEASWRLGQRREESKEWEWLRTGSSAAQGSVGRCRLGQRLAEHRLPTPEDTERSRASASRAELRSDRSASQRIARKGRFSSMRVLQLSFNFWERVVGEKKGTGVSKTSC